MDKTKITGDDLRNLITLQRPDDDAGFEIVDFAARIINFLVALAGIIAFIYLIYIGILYITSGSNPDQAKKAQGALINVIIGIIVIVLSFIIVRSVNSLAEFIVR